MDGACYFFVKQYIAHRLRYVRVNAYSKLADIPCALVAIENLFEMLGIVSVYLYYFAVLKDEFNVFEFYAVMNGRSIVSNNAVYAVSDGRRINLSVRDITLTGAFHCADTFYTEAKIRIFCDKTNFIRLIHKVLKRIHGFIHFSVIEIAYVEIEIFELFGRHARKLTHRIIGIAQNYPFGFANSGLMMHGITVYCRI